MSYRYNMHDDHDNNELRVDKRSIEAGGFRNAEIHAIASTNCSAFRGFLHHKCDKESITETRGFLKRKSMTLHKTYADQDSKFTFLALLLIIPSYYTALSAETKFVHVH